MAIAAVATMAVCASAASANTVNAGLGRSDLVKGDSLRITLSPADSGSSGYHWRVAKKPKASVLRLTSNRTVGRRQVFLYEARGAGVASLKLQYVSPGRDRKVAKRFSNTVLVSPPEPEVGCDATGSGISTIASNGTARVFTVGRAATVLIGTYPGRFRYTALYGCTRGQDRAYPLFRVGTGESLAPAAYKNLVLRGAVVGFEYQEGLLFNGDGREDDPDWLVSMDLRTGKPIRVTFPGQDGPGLPNIVTRLEMSATGGLAWTEQGREGNYVLRSDGPVAPGAGPVLEPEVLDNGSDGDVDPGSLLYDGAEITWRRGGNVQRASLR